MGIEDNLGVYPDARGTLSGLLNDLIAAVKQLPDTSDYRRAVEATAEYRLKVLEQNDSNQAVEEVLDAHMEELILEIKEELSLVPLMSCGYLSAGWQAAGCDKIRPLQDSGAV